MATAVVVYESMFGDAEKIARAVAQGLSERLDVRVIRADEAPPVLDADVRLLVVGGPNHVAGMPRPSTRAGAVKDGAEITDTSKGLREWLESAQPLEHLPAAAFDTRMDHPKLLTKFDHASHIEEKLLHKLGATLAAPAEHFLVRDEKGPLLDGEEDRARQWGAALSEIVTAGSRR